MAESDRALDRAARAKAERTDLRSKAWCFIFGHDRELWEVEVNYHFDPPIILGGRPVSETGLIPEDYKWCRRCGKVLW